MGWGTWLVYQVTVRVQSHDIGYESYHMIDTYKQPSLCQVRRPDNTQLGSPTHFWRKEYWVGDPGKTLFVAETYPSVPCVQSYNFG